MNIMYDKKFSPESVYKWLFDLDVALYAYIEAASAYKSEKAVEILSEVQCAIDPIRQKLLGDDFWTAEQDV